MRRNLAFLGVLTLLVAAGATAWWSQRQTAVTLRAELDRRLGKPDTRVFRYERRVGERRAPREDYAIIEEDMIIEVTVGAPADDDVDFDDMTRIRDLAEMPA